MKPEQQEGVEGLIAELDALEAQATPGPWEAYTAEVEAMGGKLTILYEAMRRQGSEVDILRLSGNGGKHDMRLMAALRNAWPKLRTALRSPHPAKPQPDHFAGGSNALPAGPGAVAPKEPTPRTDEAAIGFARPLIDKGGATVTELVDANFARQLERELADLKDCLSGVQKDLRSEIVRAENAEDRLAYMTDCFRTAQDNATQFRELLEAAEAATGAPHSAHASSAAFPDDLVSHVLVPREPTDEVIETICKIHARAGWPDQYDRRAQELRRGDARATYKAMLSAKEAKEGGA